MVYETKDLKRLTEELKGVMFRMNLNASKELEIALNQGENTINEFEKFNLPNIEKAAKI